ESPMKKQLIDGRAELHGKRLHWNLRNEPFESGHLRKIGGNCHGQGSFERTFQKDNESEHAETEQGNRHQACVPRRKGNQADAPKKNSKRRETNQWSNPEIRNRGKNSEHKKAKEPKAE